MIKLGPMKIGIREPRSYQSHIEWGDTFVDYWPDLEQWETVQRARRVNAIHDRITELLFSETQSPEYTGAILDTDQYRQLMAEALAGNIFHTVKFNTANCNVTAEIAEE
jgi:hypothetical protein